ncbi:MAG: TldD/PmbA family protein [Nitrosopumilus sp.]|nr:TldD/PmbA family protein [Nitrosopumilus sp.]
MSALDKAITHSKNKGIDEFEIIAIKKNITTVRITDSEIVEIKQNFDKNYGVRLIHQKKITSLQTTNIENITDIIDEGLETTIKLKPRKFWKGLPQKKENIRIEGTFDKKLKHISGSNATDIAQNMINSSENKKIDTITGSLNIVYEDFELNNSNGLNFNNESTYISGIINAESEHSITPVSGIGHACGRTLSNFSPEQIGIDAKNMCINSINPQKINSDEYTIIFDPYSVGELLAFVIAENFNFKTFKEKKSCFSNNFKNKIATEEFNLTDNPHIPEGIGTKSIDDEGTKTEKIKLIENGIFKNIFSNLYDSYKEGEEKSSGNAIRMGSPMGRSADPIPISAPHNLVITAGSSSQEDMIRDTKHGLLVGRLWYTYAVNPIKGDFSCTARSGIQIIENGEVIGPGRSVRIVHNLTNLLNNISDIGKDQSRVMQWASLPSITPSIKVENISVSSI